MAGYWNASGRPGLGARTGIATRASKSAICPPAGCPSVSGRNPYRLEAGRAHHHPAVAAPPGGRSERAGLPLFVDHSRRGHAPSQPAVAMAEMAAFPEIRTQAAHRHAPPERAPGLARRPQDRRLFRTPRRNRGARRRRAESGAAQDRHQRIDRPAGGVVGIAQSASRRVACPAASARCACFWKTCTAASTSRGRWTRWRRPAGWDARTFRRYCRKLFNVAPVDSSPASRVEAAARPADGASGGERHGDRLPLRLPVEPVFREGLPRAAGMPAERLPPAGAGGLTFFRGGSCLVAVIDELGKQVLQGRFTLVLSDPAPAPRTDARRGESRISVSADQRHAGRQHGVYRSRTGSGLSMISGAALSGDADFQSWPVSILNAVPDARERRLLECSGSLLTWLRNLPAGRGRSRAGGFGNHHQRAGT